MQHCRSLFRDEATAWSDELLAWGFTLRRAAERLSISRNSLERARPGRQLRVACWSAGRFVTAVGVFEGRIAFGYPTPRRDVPGSCSTAKPSSVLMALVHEAAHAIATATGIPGLQARRHLPQVTNELSDTARERNS